MADCDGFQYFGLQWTNACFCGNTYQNREGTNSNTDACPDGECPLSDCDEDGSLQGGLADLCDNGVGNCGWRHAVCESLAPLPPATWPSAHPPPCLILTCCDWRSKAAAA